MDFVTLYLSIFRTLVFNSEKKRYKPEKLKGVIILLPPFNIHAKKVKFTTKKL